MAENKEGVMLIYFPRSSTPCQNTEMLWLSVCSEGDPPHSRWSLTERGLLASHEGIPSWLPCYIFHLSSFQITAYFIHYKVY